ncbi:esterase [Acinetobacter sp. B5B]|uniref:YqiA/YcfP family alpha/beta fold hydrolase n=1 Tax=Acinetobacter baretiae TaxID=2605383 RepID=UPI0018C334D7|nr:YqiA/YcfP family alpha/beta fold hydrolase [Acinetobacter baretiae]MBF7681849.1 esterase [Acinetobacter baretiae]
MANPIHLIYFHGFQSHAHSVKGEQLKRYCQRYFPHVVLYLPDLNRPPQQVVEHIQCYMAQYPHHQFFCIGSSLGGFYANYIASLYALKAVLINPVVNPGQVFAQRIGLVHLPYKVTDTWSLQQQDLCFLDQMLTEIQFDHNETLVLLNTPDEVLDYQQAQQYYMQYSSRCTMVTMHYGHHVMDDFSDKIPMFMMFLLQCSTARKI